LRPVCHVPKTEATIRLNDDHGDRGVASRTLELFPDLTGSDVGSCTDPSHAKRRGEADPCSEAPLLNATYDYRGRYNLADRDPAILQGVHDSINSNGEANRWRCRSTDQFGESVITSTSTERPLLALLTWNEVLPGAPSVVVQPTNESRCIHDDYTDRSQPLSDGGGVCRAIVAEVTWE